MNGEATSSSRPNILLIVADDLAYTDIGAFGGEIHTPNLDALARAGVRFTQFYSAPTCSPTRSMLLSGMDNHQAGLGNMAEDLRENQKGHPGYEGYLNMRVAALPELLREAGYHTYMAGKWHLGMTEETSPAARGFEHSFALLQGGAGHFTDLPLVGPNPASYREDGKPVSLPADFYSSKTYSERIIQYLENRPNDGRPFFAYLAFTAPHWPLQAPAESIAKYAGRYDAGYDALQASRFARMKQLGLATPVMQMTPRIPGEKAWEALNGEERKIAARKMEIYAAMVDDLDRYLGTVLETLKRRREFDNTFIFFMSDNGPEGSNLDVGWEDLSKWVAQCCDNRFENMGSDDSYLWYGPNWARAGTPALRGIKGFASDGGIRVPAIAHFPKSIPGGSLQHNLATVMDVMPTLLDVAGVKHPPTFQGREVLPLRGTSMIPALTGARARVHAEDYVMGWELFGNRAIRQGDWKIVWRTVESSYPTVPRDPEIAHDVWRLYHLAEDPGERVDLAGTHRDVLQAMVAHWETYVRETGLVLPDYKASATP
ncbi:MAG: arylsulfatase [Verrucomicrobiota bacterium]